MQITGEMITTSLNVIKQVYDKQLGNAVFCVSDERARVSVPHGQGAAEGAGGVGGVLPAVPSHLPQVR